MPWGGEPRALKTQSLLARTGARALGVNRALRGLGRSSRASAAEFAKSVRRPPLHERPADAVLESLTRHPARCSRGKQPLVPRFRGGPRWLAVHVTDGSWARVKTDETGQAALTGSAD